jgi:hypothetical protein
VPEKLQEDSNSDHSNVGLPDPSTFCFWKKKGKKQISFTIDPFGYISFSSSPYPQFTDVTRIKSLGMDTNSIEWRSSHCNPTRS